MFDRGLGLYLDCGRLNYPVLAATQSSFKHLYNQLSEQSLKFDGASTADRLEPVVEEYCHIFFASMIAGISYILCHGSATDKVYVQNALCAVAFITVF